MRANTERPVTVTTGTNTLIGDDLARLRAEVQAVIEGRGKRGAVPPLWDGRAAERVLDALLS
jgi:UDP-N-acetylglucosamine 2-epimerase (non-hydrolysing)